MCERSEAHGRARDGEAANEEYRGHRAVLAEPECRPRQQWEKHVRVPPQADGTSECVSENQQAESDEGAGEKEHLGANPPAPSQRLPPEEDEEQWRHHQVADHVADPPGLQRRYGCAGRDDAGEAQARHADRCAQRGAADRGPDDQRDDVLDAVELRLEAGPAQHPHAGDCLQRVACGDAERCRKRRAGDEVDAKGPREHARPEAGAEDP